MNSPKFIEIRILFIHFRYKFVDMVPRQIPLNNWGKTLFMMMFANLGKSSVLRSYFKDNLHNIHDLRKFLRMAERFDTRWVWWPIPYPVAPPQSRNNTKIFNPRFKPWPKLVNSVEDLHEGMYPKCSYIIIILYDIRYSLFYGTLSNLQACL